jgi:UDP-N-acetylglucosamine 2-epimerase
VQTVWFWPNVDAGTDEVAKAIRVFREEKDPKHMHFIKYLSPEKFTALLRKCSCFVGNSSAGIKECSYLGIPSVNIGSRQEGRMRGPNVLDVPHDAAQIRSGIQKQLQHGTFEQSTVYFRKNSGATIASMLAETPLYTQKKFHSLA